MQQSRKSLLPIQRSHNTSQQRRHAKLCTHHQTCHDVSHRSRIGNIIHHDMRSSVHQNTQSLTPLQTDNATAEAVCNGKIQPKRTKAMDMRFHWLRDRQCQEQFRIYWRPGKSNYADYWTKHHPATQFITPQIVVEMLRIEQSRIVATAAA